MAPNRGRNRADEFESFVESGAIDFDPEEDFVSGSDDSSVDHGESASDTSGDDENGRGHYIDVGKSKLRKPKDVALGPQYRGLRVSREAVLSDDDDDDDPFSRGFDEEDSDSEEFGGEGDDSDSAELEESEDDGAETMDTDLSNEELDDQPVKKARPGESVKEQLRKGLNTDTEKSVAASMLQANKNDAEKGRAVKCQRAAFDSLLQVRMKLQKSLVATNTLVGLDDVPTKIGQDDAQVFEAAEVAAFNLWQSLTQLRDDLSTERTGQKRKRVQFESNRSTEDLLVHTQGQEADIRSTRDNVLRKWSKKSQGPTVVSERGRLNQTESRATIIDVLQEQLSNSDRLVKRTHAPRSCAPLQASKQVTEDEKIYDDADFYSLLLKELLENRSQNSVAAANIDLGFQLRREAKTKRNVDTKASKGRKLRYTVHEKLQNFMAPEDQSSWGERQVADLFGSLFGQQLGLGENDREHVDMENNFDPEEAGLLMFRT